jgi:predicted N-acetyltransferase YhbS
MELNYSCERRITAAEFIDLLRRSTLAERRPVDDLCTMEAMLAHAGILCTAWYGELLVGVARSVTDFAYCCYLSDLAVDMAYQGQGVGKRLIQLTREQLGPRAKIILLSAPAAESYYPKVGFTQHRSAWTLAGE